MPDSIPEAFLLVTLENATITTSGLNQMGVLGLGYISVQTPDASCADRDVYLFLRLGSLEAPIDPNGVIQRTDGEGWRSYAFHSTDVDLTEINVTFSLPVDPKSSAVFMEDLEMFESILAQYVDFHSLSDFAGQTSYPVGDNDVIGPGSPDFPSQEDLRGHLVAIDQDTGKMVGQFDDRQFRIQEDPELSKGGGGDVVIMEIPDTTQSQEKGRTPMEMFVHTVPADHQDRTTKSAILFSRAISQTTNLILTTITATSNYYGSHLEPSQDYLRHTPNTTFAVTPPLPPRAFDFLTSERTHKGLAGVHAVSGQAARISSKTVSIIDNMIRRAMGAKPKRPRAFPGVSRSPPPRMLCPAGLLGTQPPSTSRTLSDSRSPSKSYLVPSFNLPLPNEKPALPPRRSPSPNSSLFSGTENNIFPAKKHAPLPSYSNSTIDPLFLNDKPPLPPRSSPSPAIIPRAGSGAPPDITPLLNHQRTTKNSLLLSIDLILSTLDYSARELLNGGAESLGTVVEHKYGPDARHTSMLLAGTARNIGLVYIDMTGIGRRALLKRAGVHFAKGRLFSG